MGRVIRCVECYEAEEKDYFVHKYWVGWQPSEQYRIVIDVCAGTLSRDRDDDGDRLSLTKDDIQTLKEWLTDDKKALLEKFYKEEKAHQDPMFKNTDIIAIPFDDSMRLQKKWEPEDVPFIALVDNIITHYESNGHESANITLIGEY